MCVEKPIRQANSTEAPDVAPRRKRAVTERLHVFTPATSQPPVAVSAPVRGPAAAVAEPKKQQVAVGSSAGARQTLEKARTLPLAEARLGLAKTQPIASVVAPVARGPRRIRPVAPLPTRGTAPVAPAVKPEGSVAIEVKPAPIPVPVRPTASAQVTAPTARAQVTLPAAQIDQGWSQGRKRSRVEPGKPLRPLKMAEGTQPGVEKKKLSSVPAAGKNAVPRPTERPALARGSVPPPTTGKPLPSLFSIIDSKKPEPQSSSSGRLPGLPPPSPPRTSIGSKKAVSSVVAAASLGAAPMSIAATRQTGEHSLVPPPVAVLLDDEIEEIEEIEPDLPDFVATGAEAAGMLSIARSKSAPLFDAPPRRFAAPAMQLSAAEAAFFAAGDELDTLEMEPGDDSFDDLPAVERPSFWSRLKNRASAGH
jgi:hypothetical protein